jgi:hypothetical protein
MRLGWDEIARRAKAFSEEWRDAHYEKGDTQTFYNEFFEVFGIRRRTVAVYEQRVKLLDNKHGFIDLFWPGTLLVEQKSGRLDLGKAQGQALDYLQGVHPTQQPRWILTCDFQNWVLLDLDTGKELKFRLADLHRHVSAFDFMLGRRVTFETQAGVTIKAAELMGKLHDALEESGYIGHDLEQLLVRLLFCLFADDTGIFQPKDIFLQLIENDTRPDGSDTGRVLNELFDVLDCPDGANGTGNRRQANLSGELNQFPYVNGRLFAERLRTAVFDAKMREYLLDAARHDWSGVSPAIFGSLFQSVMNARERRAKGAHYTSEENILKVIGPLFLDELREELARIKARKSGRDKALAEFQNKLTRLTFLDPACGCGNFLVIAYREIRRLELEALKAQYGDQQIDAALLSRVTVDQFYGIEFEEFPAKIAEVAMWMMDHIANNEINEAFRLNYARIPLKDGAHILHADALETDWAALLPPETCSYVMGNPPFVGAKYQTQAQREQVRSIARIGGSGGTLDYVAAWFLKAGLYISSCNIDNLEYNASSVQRPASSAPYPRRVRGHQFDHPRRTSGAALAAAVRSPRAGNRLRSPDVFMGQRGARQGPRSCGHRRARPPGSRAGGEATVFLSRHQGRPGREPSRCADSLSVRCTHGREQAFGREGGGEANQQSEPSSDRVEADRWRLSDLQCSGACSVAGGRARRAKMAAALHRRD